LALSAKFRFCDAASLFAEVSGLRIGSATS
jgi:hypothetical protein